ncbi:MAG: hypothetical protein ACI807_003362 [Paracoccaceae bacterium]|jgi:hypothetical protein
MPNSPILVFDIDLQLRLSWLDVLDRNPPRLSPIVPLPFLGHLKYVKRGNDGLGYVGRVWCGQSLGLVAFQSLSTFDGQVRSSSRSMHLMVSTKNHLITRRIGALISPQIALYFAQIQAESPSFFGVGQPDQKFGDPLVLAAQSGAVVKAGLAKAKGPAGHSDADPAADHRRHGHPLHSRRYLYC